MRNLRWIIFLPAAVLASVSPASADTYTENFDDPQYDLPIQPAPGVSWCDAYANQYGTAGPSLCVFSPQGPTVFTFPAGIQVQGFQFVAGAKNGFSQLTVFYSDGTTGDKPIDGTCCEATVVVEANEGKAITGFALPAEWDLWLFDSLEWWAASPDPTTTSSEPEQTTSTVEQTSSTSTSSTTTTVQETTTTSSTSTSSSTVPTTSPPPPPDTQPTVETTSPETTLPETTVPTTLPAVATTVATTVPPTTTTEPVPTTTSPPDASGAPESVVNPDPVVDTGVIEQPSLDAPIEERLEFESKVNVFSGEYDDYVPVGSKISVAERRTVVAVTAVLIMFAPPPSRMRKQ